MKYRTLGRTGLQVSQLALGGSSLGSVSKEIDELGRVEVDQIQSYGHYCLNDTALLDILPFLQKQSVVIFNAAPLVMRLLTPEGPPDWHQASPGVKAKCLETGRYCKDRGSDLAKLALQFSVAHPDISTNIVGKASPERGTHGGGTPSRCAENSRTSSQSNLALRAA